LASHKALGQSLTDTEIKQINKDLALGLKCCELLDAEELKFKMTDSALNVTDLALKNSMLANSEYSASLNECSTSLSEAQEKYTTENQKKKTWRQVGILASLLTVIETVYILKQ
jgi:hypothetical protein